MGVCVNTIEEVPPLNVKRPKPLHWWIWRK